MSHSRRSLSFVARVAVIVFTASSCLAETPASPAPGGRNPVDIKDPYITNIACWAVQKMDETTESIFEQALVDIVSGTQQVVAGMLYQLTIRVMETVCVKHMPCDNQCYMQDCDASPKVCQVTVWDQPWLERRELSSSSCS